MSPWLIREFGTLKDANREAYRLARCYYGKSEVSVKVIVGNNTGITLNASEFNECIRYSIENCKVFDNIFSWIHVYWGNETQHSFSIRGVSRRD